mmetsp:Transcript_27569/g.44848  ORF Transcript_27569/g.44848 Transcript_27569/m.44848 type:complete len:163 (+) Transcript_27569:401-889(+)
MRRLTASGNKGPKTSEKSLEDDVIILDEAPAEVEEASVTSPPRRNQRNMKRKEQDKVNGNMIVNVKRGYVDPLEWDHWTGPEKDECIAKWNPGQVNDFYRSFLEMFGVRDQDTEGDGNCFFHALSHVLANTFPRSHQELRAWSVHNMKDTCTEESYSNLTGR